MIEVPAMIEAIIGFKPPGEYHTIITILAMAVAFYGSRAAYRLVSSGLESAKINRVYEGLIKEVATGLNKTEDELKKMLEERYGQSGSKRLATAAVRFFSPPKHEGGVTVKAGEIEVAPDVVREVPSITEFEKPKPEGSG